MKEWEDTSSFKLNVDLIYFCGVIFWGLVVPYEVMGHVLGDHGSQSKGDEN